jgi:hypothetical protein
LRGTRKNDSLVYAELYLPPIGPVMRFQVFSISFRATAAPVFPPLSLARSTVNFCGPPTLLARRFTNARTGNATFSHHGLRRNPA